MIIISGYQGVGKSTFAKDSTFNVVDFESSNYDKSNKEWYKDYVQDIIKHDVDIIFISSHLEVRTELNRLKQSFYFVLPDVSVQHKWTHHLAKRVESNNFISKDIRALMSHILKYDDVIKELRDNQIHFVKEPLRPYEKIVFIKSVDEFIKIVSVLVR